MRTWLRGFSRVLLGFLLSAASAWAGAIDTDFLQGPWPRERSRQLEVGRYPVRWHEGAGKSEGIFAGVQFETPLPQQAVWELANDYQDVGAMTPGVIAVRYLEKTADRQVIQLDVKVLWKTLRLTFEVEQDPPEAIRFRLVNRSLGEYRGLCLFKESASSAASGAATSGTTVDLITWLKPAHPVPMGLLLFVERMTILQGVKSFLESCEEYPS